MRTLPSIPPHRAVKFWQKVALTANPERCWLWTAAKQSKTDPIHSYGMFNLGGSMYVASRLAYKICTGNDPDEMEVLHSCDNPSCVNPRHLFLGTQATNMQDCRDKGRRYVIPAVGEQNGRAKLSEIQVLQIR